MAGYVRQDTTGAISTGNIIEADDLNAEFDAVVGAFSATAGHTHDGTTAEGAPIEVVGPTQDVVITATTMRPKTTNTVDVGTSSLKYKDVHSAGTAFLTIANISGNTTIGGTLGVTGLITATGGVSGSLTGNASTATALQTARTIGGVSFNGTANINLPGVNQAGNQNTTGSAASLTTARNFTIGATARSFDGTANVSWNLTDIGAASRTLTLTAGTGITGGGDLTANRTFDIDTAVVATLTGTQTITNKTITAINYRETVGTISGSTLDLATGNVFLSTPSTNATYVFSNPPASGTAYGFTLRVAPSATITVTWPASVKWPDGLAPLAPASGATSVYVFYTQDAGTTYFGFVAGESIA
jgi:hypothetical protein